MREQLGLVPRALTGTVATPEQREVQERIHECNLNKIALLKSRGMPEKYITASDEFGCYYFPLGKIKWARKGSKTVTNEGAKVYSCYL